MYREVIDLQYGTMPPKPEVFQVELLYKGGKGRADSYRITAGTKEKTLSFRMQIFNPYEYKFEKMPVIIDGDACFVYSFDKEFLDAALNEGIGWVFFDRTELAHDISFEGRAKGALYEIYPSYTFGALGAWAWGYSRILDCVSTMEEIDGEKAVCVGHSRIGKTSLWAGVEDERFKVVCVNDSGCGGAALSRRLYGETIYSMFNYHGIGQYWFTDKMANYVEKLDELPFDQHCLIALVAPRAVAVHSATEDQWADPKSEYMATYLAGEVYKLYGKEVLENPESPAPNVGVGTDVSYFLREGAHDILLSDWEQYLNAADHTFGK